VRSHRCWYVIGVANEKEVVLIVKRKRQPIENILSAYQIKANAYMVGKSYSGFERKASYDNMQSM
jgi:hypothetical protein